LALAGRASTIEVTGSIQEAITRAQQGDTVLVTGPAVYHEHIVVDKPLRLVGTNAPVVEGDGKGTPLTIRAAGCEARGLTVRNGGADLGNFDAGIMIFAPQVTVAQCTVQGGGFGIYIRGVDQCRVEENTVQGNMQVPPSKRGNGIHLWKTKRNTIAGNFISGTRDGAYFSYADQNLIASNRIEQTRFGIHYMYSHDNQLLGNTLKYNAVGAALMFARNCRVEGNRAFANRRHGILLKQVEHSTFLHNAVYGQNRGFFIQQAAQDRFEGNAIAQNDIGLYLSNGSEQNVFTGNAFIRNTDQIWQPQDEVELGRLASNRFAEKGRGNFWSDYSGTDADGDGIGDTPYHETGLYGYIVDRHPELRVFALSPAAALLRKGEEILPLLDTHGVTDPFPLEHAPAAVLALLPASTELMKKVEPLPLATAAGAGGTRGTRTQSLPVAE
jgi:nitrous oxidase accessory protein